VDCPDCTNNDTMPSVAQIVVKMKRNPKGVRFGELCRVCDFYFGTPRQSGSSHRVYRTPWTGNPRVNIQDDKGYGKAYQVRQVLAAIQRLEESNESD
jgi:hypothetical protein